MNGWADPELFVAISSRLRHVPEIDKHICRATEARAGLGRMSGPAVLFEHEWEFAEAEGRPLMSRPFTLSEAIERAKKLLGDQGHVPQPKSDEDKAVVALNKASSGLSKATLQLSDAADALEAQIVSWEDALSALLNAQKLNAAQYGSETFGLDARSKEGVKVIKQVRQIFADYFDGEKDEYAKETKRFDDVEKRLIQLQKNLPG